MLRKHRCWGLLCLLALSILAEVWTQETPTNSEDEKKEDKRVFGGGKERQFISRSKKAGSNGGGKIKTGIKSPNKGCKRPENLMNASLYCTTISGCSVTCFKGYKLPNGNTRLALLCVDGEWQMQNTEWEKVPPCEPICDPACQNNGICTGPDQCDCPENYNGPQCQYTSSPCLNFPQRPNNVKRTCSSRTCTLSCIDEHHRFPDGSSVTNMMCKDGVWTPSRPDWAVVPDCKPICDPPCENGGECLAHNMCQCPQEYRGPQCQYDVSQCTVNKLKQVFNGGASCTDSMDLISCVLSCPIGTVFEQAAVSQYICLFSDGVFRPQPPRCIPVGADVEIMSLGSNPQIGSYRNYSQRMSVSSSLSSSYATNTSWTDLLTHSVGSRVFTDIDTMPKIVTTEKLPAPGICYTWSGDHYKTFDGRILSFRSNCSYMLARDSADGTFSVNLEWEEDHRKVVVYAQDREYSLTRTPNGLPILMFGSRQMAIPASLTGVTVEFQGNYVLLSLTALGVDVKWDGSAFVSVAVTQAMWNRTSGLCGRIDGYQENDLESKTGTIPKRLITFVDSWKVEKLEETCGSVPSEEHTCNYPPGGDSSLAKEAKQFCSKLFTNPSLTHCEDVVAYDLYFQACRWDYCGCTEADRSLCACNTLAVYVRECNRLGDKTVVNWRDDSLCPVNCTGGRVYSSCVSNTVETCGSMNELSTSIDKCEEGCYCPSGTVLHDQKCIQKEQCPCQLRGRTFAPGKTIPKGCNTCDCINGQWECTQVNCGARCSAVGDPHYVTFDGRHFDFMGKCSYYLVKGSNYSIEAENVACAGSISEQMGFSFFSTTTYPSCTKTVTIRMGDRYIKLQQNREVTVNGREVLQMPFTMDGATIRIASSIFLIVDMPNGLELWWDGLTRLYIDAPASLKGQTKGLCGTFNHNQNDDFLTPENDVEQSVVSFANKWKTQEVCEDLPEKVVTHPCEANIQNKASAEAFCGKLKGPLFAGCHWSVDPESYYQDCLYDLCSCEGKIGQCLCPILASYAKECSHHGLQIDFRNEIAECSVVCPGEQKYQVCGNSCTRSCFDITQRPECRQHCVEGCNCPEGQTLDSNGECIPIAHCTCHSNGVDHPSGYKEVRPSSQGLELCSCANAVWDCHLATQEEIDNNPDSNAQNCSLIGNEVYTPCEPVEPVTCKNMHSPPEYSPAKCVPGCECKKGYVLDSHTKKCVLPSECPCHHGGKSYSDGHKMQEDCNVCTCEGGKWNCSSRQCSGICTAWGDSHFKTFDGKIYDFSGNCNYMLAKGNSGNQDVFDIFIQNVPCSSSGITCSKSVTLKVGEGSKVETITFVRDEPLPSFKELNRITVREAGLFVFAEVFDLGLVLQWDRATRVYIKVDPVWLNKVNGLCGNYNNDQLDDFQTPTGGASEVSPIIFGDSWKLQSYCPAAVEIEDACALHPQRKVHALKKCGVLKSKVFQPCHSEVPLEPYLDRCIFDTCACDLGGDCECLCTAIAAYAQECNIRGVPIKWRTQQLCPIQCDERCSHYSSCVETCPKETCDNHLVYKSLTPLCKEDSCVEGCEIKPCPPGQIYSNLTSLECVPEAKCETVCMQVDNIIYKEGDILEQDECHTCFCSRHKKICKGKPCVSPRPPTTVKLPETPPLECVPGWSSWISINVPGRKQYDEEPIPSHHYLLTARSPAACDPSEVSDIKCRVVGTHEDYSDRMNKSRVLCSRSKGLQCTKSCDDYEIQVYCACGSSTTVSVTVTQPEKCDVARPNSPHPTECTLFYQCEDTPTGPRQVEKSCGMGTWYNPVSMICDWPHSVLQVRPECSSTRITTSPAPYSPVTPGPVPPVKCDMAKPKTPDTYDCHKYYQCVEGPDGPQMKEKKCGPGTLFNHISLACEWPQSVLQVRPECASTRITTSPAPYSPVTPGPVPPVNCDMAKPKTPDTYDCHKYYQCVEGPDGPQMKEKKCGPGTWFNHISLACEWPQSVLQVRPECASTATRFTTSQQPYSTVSAVCLPGESWVECAVPCGKMCQYYDHEVRAAGKCPTSYSCLQGCRPVTEEIYCPVEYLWRDEFTCVPVADCTCRSKNGTIVKPGIPYWESECEICQCVNDKYVCDDSSCFYTATQKTTTVITEMPETTTMHVVTMIETPGTPIGNGSQHVATTTPSSSGGTPIIVIPSSTTPPMLCDQDNLINLIDGPKPLPPSTFTASSYLSSEFSPQAGRLGNKENPSEYSWTAQHSDKHQYLQVDLGQEEPVYGAVVQGSPLTDEYVSSYKVLHSLDGQTYSYITDKHKQPMVFRGPINSKQPVVQMFHNPVEARYIRFVPETWSQAISMKVELIGCGQPLTTSTSASHRISTTPSILTIPPSSKFTRRQEEGSSTIHQTPPATLVTLEPEQCTEPMGVENGVLPTSQITVSSVLGNDIIRYGPAQARLNKARDEEHEGAWVPATKTSNEWIQFDFFVPQHLTGVITQGADGGNKWVEAYKVFYSHDGQAWNPIVNQDGSEKVFPANFDSSTKQTDHFHKTIRAQYLRIVPVMWHNGIAMRLEVLGCFYPYPGISSSSTVPVPATPTIPPTGLTLTCQLCPSLPLNSVGADKCNCSNLHSWDGHKCVPKVECPCFVGSNVYQPGAVFISEECKQCMCSLDGLIKCESRIPCDYCGDDLQSVVTPSCGCVCKPCPPDTKLCPTSNICIGTSLWCDGYEDCPDDERTCTTLSTPAIITPPFTHVITHKTAFTSGGGTKVMTRTTTTAVPPITETSAATPETPAATPETPAATPETPAATPETPAATPETPAATLETPAATLETPAATPETPAVTPETPAVTPATLQTTTGIVPVTVLPPCPPVVCPIGYTVEMIQGTKTKKNPFKKSRKRTYSAMGQYKGVYKLKGGSKLPPPGKTAVQLCPRFKCKPLPKICKEPPTCQNGKYLVSSGTVPNGPDDVCFEYTCMAYPAVCNVTGRTIVTFDSTEYQYDFCDHLLARDAEYNKWRIYVYKDCSSSASCYGHITVIHDMHELELYNDQRVGIDGYIYEPEKVQNMEYQDYAIYKVGDSLHMVSFTYLFWVTINSQGNVMIGVDGSLFGRVDGLCGFFDGMLKDDKRKPDGSLAHTTKDFGNSWAHNNNSEACQPVTCPLEMREKALKLCSVVEKKPLSLCKGIVNMDQFIARCIQSTCSCLQSNSTEEDCKCKALGNFVTDCQMADNRIDLTSWRVIHDCPSSCPPDLVYHECYRHQCERSCSNLQEEDPCPTTSICFTGCFCPEGLVRDKDKCVKPSQCRDCVCDGFGDPQYISFDRKNFAFNGNCTYVAARDISVNGNRDFEVLVTNDNCKHDQKSTCTKAVTVLFEDHAIGIVASETESKLEAMVDGKTVANYPLNNGWIILDGNPLKKLTIVIPKIQLEVSYFFENFGFVVQLPSHLYSGKTEGLCGNCNNDPTDDFKTSEGKLTNDTDDFGMSWLQPELSNNEECRNAPPPRCQPLPADEDVCQNLLDRARFGECHAIVNPDSYYEACKSDVCNSTEAAAVACRVFEAYARECLREGVCLSWRSKHICPYHCEEGFEYRCGTGCTETCDNYELHRKNPSACLLSKIDGCFCPPGKVLHNGKCVEESRCKPCDENGHYSGDKWNPNACTSCSCNGTMMECKKTTCPLEDRLCNPPLVPVIIANASNSRCCPDYTCKLEKNPCPEVQQPVCNDDQVLQLTTMANNCSAYVCRCKTDVECQAFEIEVNVEPADEPPLKPGQERVIDKTGCCERSKIVCNVTQCPIPLQCPQFYKMHELPASEELCCSVYNCEPPKDVCLYEHQHIASTKGGERKRKPSEKFTVEKTPGSTWQDGPCRECSCSGSDLGEYQTVCTKTLCVKLEDEPTAADYVLEHVPAYGSCCPDVKRVACKDNGNEYPVDTTWASSSGDRCQTITCESKDGNVQKVTFERACREICDLGFLYEPSPPESTECCGQCKPVACVDNGKLYDKGSIWYSPDHCTQYDCRTVNESFQIHSATKACGETPQEVLDNYVVEEVVMPGECCKKIKKTQCKEGETVYEIGETWLSPYHNCKSIKCIASGPDNQALKEETKQACPTECDEGWQYQPPAAGSSKCCGKCVQVACLVNGTLYNDGETWKDNCTTYSCDKRSNQFQITSNFPCSNDTTCPREKMYSDGCCWKCNITSDTLRNCKPKPQAIENTVNLIKHHSKQHGLCINQLPVDGFTECDGNCQSSTRYNSKTNQHESNCRCCQPTKVTHIPVDLVCERGNFILTGYNVSVPTECGCEVCSGNTEGVVEPGIQSSVEYAGQPEPDYGTSIPDVVY